MVDLICKICPQFTHLTSENSQISPADLHSNNTVIKVDATYTSDLLTGNGLGGKEVLGISWYPISDVLEFDVAISLHTLMPTKHNIVSFASRFYDHWASCHQQLLR